MGEALSLRILTEFLMFVDFAQEYVNVAKGCKVALDWVIANPPESHILKFLTRISRET
jgi:hypothetical protein